MRTICAGLLITTAIAWTGAAQAQDQPSYGSTDPTAVLPAPPPQAEPLQTPPVEAVPQTSDAPIFVLRSVRFNGESAVPEARLEEAWRPYVGRQVSFDDLRRIGRAAELVYAQAGYPFVAVVLTPQQVTEGVVDYQVVEGRISDLTVLGLDPVARRQVTGVFSPLVGRAPLPLRDVETAYQTASDIPGLSLAGSLRRGSEPGGMDLVVQARRRTWRAYINANNYYSEAVGPWGVLAGLEYNGASAYGDRTTLQVYATTDIGEQEVVKLSHWRALNSRGTSLSADFTRAWAEPEGVVAPLDLATDVVMGSLEVRQVLHSRGRLVIGGYVGLTATDQETQVFGNIQLTQDKLRIAIVGLDARYRGARFTFDGGIEYRQGLDILGASSEGDPDLSRLDADPQAGVLRANVRGNFDLPHNFAISGTVLAQYSSSSLTAPEEFAAGNLTIGRGYVPGSNFGDSAVGAALELWLPPVRLGRGFSVRPFGFYDVARVWNEEAGASDNHTLSSAGGGLRFEAEGRFRVDLTYARPLDPPLGLGEPRPGDRLLVNFTIGIPDAFRGVTSLFRRGSNP